MHMDIENLINCQPEDIDGISSPKMTAIYKASELRKLERKLLDGEAHTIKIADLEIEFEKGRRIYNYGAPSRLSCLYLAEDDFDSRMMLRNMFVNVFSRPKIINVDILNKMELVQVDHCWIDKYFEESKEENIKNYWSGIAYDEDDPSWEYLLEGTIIMTDTNQMEEIDNHVRDEFPIFFEEIMKQRTSQ